MTRPHHFISISGGKDSQAVLCLSVERFQRRGWGNRPPRYLFADTGNEDQRTIDHVAYLSEWLRGQIGATIETVSAYDVPGLIDAEAFARKRAMLPTEWRKEKRVRQHTAACKARRESGLRATPWLAACRCPVRVSPPVSEERIAAAVEALQPTGVAFLDMAMLHGRFPSVRTRFCTDELKLMPMDAIKRPLIDDGESIVEWIGERAEESPARAAKPPIQRIRHASGATQILYRPVFRMTARDMFAISKRHGLRPNPLYLEGHGRVGCFPCIMSKKGQLANIAARAPHAIDRLEEWERIVGLVSRRVAMGGSYATFFRAKMVPGGEDDHTRASIRKAADWSMTGRGGRQYDMLLAAEAAQIDADGGRCDSEYGLCE